MRFELDKILIDEIIFCMENQDGDFLLDIQKRSIVDSNNCDYEPGFDNDRFISLPHWDSNDGYRLMEKFVLNSKNPVLREELSVALNRKKGVFRAFRDVLLQYPETEKQWYRFKDQQMKNEVIAWYNALREEWGLEPIGSEPEDDTSVVLEDFVIREQATAGNEKSGITFAAETANGEPAGIISAELDGSNLLINILKVKPEYRSMGIGKTLLAKLLEKADEQKLDVTIDLPSDADSFARILRLENFKPVMQRFLRNNVD